MSRAKPARTTPPPAPAPKMTQREAIECVLAIRQERADRTLADFTAKVAKDAAHALAWQGDDAFRFAAVRSVCIRASAILASQGLRGLDGHAHGEVVRGAQWGSSSTSACSNLMERWTTAAWADLYETLHAIVTAPGDFDGEGA